MNPYGDHGSEICRRWSKINSGISHSENNIATNELWDRGRMKIENYISLFPRLTPCWESAALILLVMLGAKQQQWINKITHLNMPVNLIILEQRRGGRTTAGWLTEAEMRAGTVAKKIQISLFAFFFLKLFFGRNGGSPKLGTVFIKCGSLLDANLTTELTEILHVGIFAPTISWCTKTQSVGAF